MENQKLPNATAVLILGILSILGCCCYGVVGIILAIVALVLAKKDMVLYKENPQNYDNFKNLNTGKILAIIGLSLSILYLLFMIFAISYFGFDNLNDPEKLQEIIREMQRQ
jgi:hypothetical protein